MNSAVNKVQNNAITSVGDLDAFSLSEQLGGLGITVPWDKVAQYLKSPEISNAQELTEFLNTYHAHILGAVEFPCIMQAWKHTQKGEVRELIALDKELGQEPKNILFARASQLVGCQQLRRLRPLHDHRVVQRYLKAVDSGQATGWHPLVFGMTLAVYSLPPRQGLLRYGEEVLYCLADAVVYSRRLPQTAFRKSYDSAVSNLPATIDRSLVMPEFRVI